MKPLHLGLVAGIFIGSCILSGFTKMDAQADIASVLLPFAGALTGIVLATIGIIMGSVGAIYNSVASTRTPDNAKRIESALNSLDSMVNELRDDCILVIAGFGVLLGCYFFARMDIPSVTFPSFGGFGKMRILESFSIFFVILSFWAIYDTVSAVFALHAHAALLARENK